MKSKLTSNQIERVSCHCSSCSLIFMNMNTVSYLGRMMRPGFEGERVFVESEHRRERFPGSEFNGERFSNRENVGYFKRK